MRQDTRHRIAITVLVLVALVSCSEPTPPVPAEPRPDLVWPPAPMTPRIMFLQTLSKPEDAGVRAGLLDRVWVFLEGAPERPTTAPYGLFKDTDGRLYVVDTFQKAVQVFDTESADHYWFPDEPIEGFNSPIGVVADGAGMVYVSDSESNAVHLFADHGKRYLRSFGHGVLSRPTGLALDPVRGKLLVADTLASQIVVFDTNDLRPVRFVGHEGTDPRSFHYPTNIALAPDGRVYVTDSMNFRIQRLDSDLAFLGSFGQIGDTPGDFSRPKGVGVDSEGHVYVVDALFDNVQIFDAEGRLLLAFGSPGSEPGKFWLPNSIFVDEQDRIYVSDAYNQRIQVFQYLKEGRLP